MREIKFRAWHPDQGMTMTPVLSTSSYTGKVICTGYDKNLHEITLALMQYTGLKDKKGVEIYEGDIVSSDFYEPEIKCLAAISYSNEYAQYCFVNASGDLNGEQDAFKYGNLTVIGNIHENPELLD